MKPLVFLRRNLINPPTFSIHVKNEEQRAVWSRRILRGLIETSGSGPNLQIFGEDHVFSVIPSSVDRNTVRGNLFESLEANFGLLSQTHPTTRYIRNLMKEVHADFSGLINVLRDAPEPSAFITNEGDIFVSRGITNFVRSMEELAAVIAHEDAHGLFGHDKFIQGVGLLQKIGAIRISEAEADFRALLSLNDAGINPAGMMDLFKRLAGLRDKDGKMQGSFTHGSAIDRYLNIMLYALSLVNLKQLSHERTPLPASIQSTKVVQPLEDRIKDMSMQDFQAFVSKADGTRLALIISELIENRLKKRRYNDLSEINQKIKISFLAMRGLIERRAKKLGLNDDVIDIAELYFIMQAQTQLSIKGYKRLFRVAGTRQMNYKDPIVPLKEFAKHFDSLLNSPSMGMKPVNAATYGSHFGTFSKLSAILLKGMDDKGHKIESYIQVNECFSVEVERIMGLQGEDFCDASLTYNHAMSSWKEVNEDTEKDVFDPDKVDEDEIIQTMGVRAKSEDQIQKISDLYKQMLEIILKRNDLSWVCLGLLLDEAGVFVDGVISDRIIKRLISENQLQFEGADMLLKSTFSNLEIFKQEDKTLFFNIGSITEDYFDDLITFLIEWRNKVSFGNPIPVNIRFIKSRGKDPIWLAHQSEQQSDCLDDMIQSMKENDLQREIILFLKMSHNRLIDAYYYGPDVDGISMDHVCYAILGTIYYDSSSSYILLRFAQICNRAAHRLGIEPLKISGEYLKNIKQVLFERLEKVEQIEDYQNIIDALFPYYDIVDLDFLSDTLYGEPFTNAIINKYKKARDPIERLKLASLIPNRIDRIEVQRKIVEEILSEMTFPEARSFLEEWERRLNPSLIWHGTEYACQHLPRTLEEHDDALKFFRLMLDSNKRNLAEVSLGSIIDQRFFEKFEGGDRWLITALSTAESDEEFRREGWREYQSLSDPQIKEYLPWGNEGMRRNWVGSFNVSYGTEQIDSIEKPALTRLMESAYFWNPIMKGAFVRRCLIGEHGILMSKEGTHEMLNRFFDLRLNGGDEKMSSLIREVAGIFVDVASPEELCMILEPLLRDQVFRPPLERYSQAQFARDKAREIEAEQHDNFVKRAKGNKREYTPEIQQRTINDIAQKVLNMMLGQQIPIDEFEKTEKKRGVQNKLYEAVGIKPGGSQARMSPMELILIVGQLFHAPGVRFLQLLRQYVDIPEEYREAFEKVYDSMSGQHRMSFYWTLKDEAREHPEIAQYVDQIKEIGKRIGGGSMVTVHTAKFKDGSVDVIKVMNPNVLYRLNMLIDIMRRVSAEMKRRHPEDAETYNMIGALIDDIAEWVEGDFRDEGYLENDSYVFETYNGRRDAGEKVEVKVPQATYLPSNLIRVEEYVPGYNFTKIRNLNLDRSDHRALVSLYVRIYFDMLLDGIVFSDLSPGNVRVSKYGKLVLMDRHFYQQDPPEEIDAIRNLRDGGEPFTILEGFLNHLLSLPENKDLNISATDLIPDLISAQMNGKGDVESMILDAVLVLKKRGVSIPLRITLLLKNIKVLNNMARDAGFDSFLDCLS